MNKRKKEKYKPLQANKDINIHDCSHDELNESASSNNSIDSISGDVSTELRQSIP